MRSRKARRNTRWTGDRV